MPIDLYKKCWMSGKQCRPWSDALSAASDLGLPCFLRPACPNTKVIRLFVNVGIRLFVIAGRLYVTETAIQTGKYWNVQHSYRNAKSCRSNVVKSTRNFWKCPIRHIWATNSHSLIRAFIIRLQKQCAVKMYNISIKKEVSYQRDLFGF